MTTSKYQFNLLSSAADREAVTQLAGSAGTADSLLNFEELVRARATLLADEALARADGSLADSSEEYKSLFIDSYTRGFLSKRNH